MYTHPNVFHIQVSNDIASYTVDNINIIMIIMIMIIMIIMMIIMIITYHVTNVIAKYLLGFGTSSIIINININNIITILMKKDMKKDAISDEKDADADVC